MWKERYYKEIRMPATTPGSNASSTVTVTEGFYNTPCEDLNVALGSEPQIINHESTPKCGSHSSNNFGGLTKRDYLKAYGKENLPNRS